MLRRGESRAPRDPALGGVSGGAGVAESLTFVRRESPDDGGRGPLTGDYLVGQVADSLVHGARPSGGAPGRLAALFSSVEPQLQPVFVPVPKVSHRVPLLVARQSSLEARMCHAGYDFLTGADRMNFK